MSDLTWRVQLVSYVHELYTYVFVLSLFQVVSVPVCVQV